MRPKKKYFFLINLEAHAWFRVTFLEVSGYALLKVATKSSFRGKKYLKIQNFGIFKAIF